MNGRRNGKEGKDKKITVEEIELFPTGESGDERTYKLERDRGVQWAIVHCLLTELIGQKGKKKGQIGKKYRCDNFLSNLEVRRFKVNEDLLSLTSSDARTKVWVR